VKVDDWIRTGLPGVLPFARALVGDRGTAEDIVQDVLTRLVAEPERFEGVDDLDAYVRRMIVNTFISWGRKWFRVRPTALVPDDPSAHGDPVDGVLDRDELRSGLARLPRRQRAVIVLRYYEDLSNVEIAELLGCRPGTVRSHVSRALSALRIDLASTQEEVNRLP
jgi:RNA polymerase sigma-70 factor (sigma-E family)